MENNWLAVLIISIVKALCVGCHNGTTLPPSPNNKLHTVDMVVEDLAHVCVHLI